MRKLFNEICIYVYMYMYICIYIHIYIYTHIHIYLISLIGSGNYSVDYSVTETFKEKDYHASLNQDNLAWRAANWIEHLISPVC